MTSFINSLEFLVGITGSYAGAGIQYVVPAFLVYFGRKVTHKTVGVGVKNQHESWFKSTAWIVFVQVQQAQKPLITFIEFLQLIPHGKSLPNVPPQCFSNSPRIFLEGEGT